MLGEIYGNHGMVDDAIRMFKKAMKIVPYERPALTII